MKINSGGKNTGHQVEVKTGLGFHHQCCLSEEDWGKMKLNELRRQNQKGRIPGSRQSTQKPRSNPLKA